MNDGATTPPDRKYAVFISYRHADNKEQGRQWATWLHHTLETYEVPPDLVGRPNLRGEPVPASLYPVFRDEEELPADADLSANIQRALRHSALLVVLCSPRAVESRFVADEIRVFKELGKAGHILALMIDGEPNAIDDPGKARTGIRPEHECLPEPLRYGVPRADGSIDWTQRTEPIAADVRPENKPAQGWTTAAAYREELTRKGLAKPEIDRLTTAYEEQLQLATLKIIAGAIGLPLGEVTQRDKRHAEEKLKRARQELSRTEFLFARQLLDLKDYPKAYARLAKAIKIDAKNRAAIMLALGLVRNAANRGHLQIYYQKGVSSAAFSPCGDMILITSAESAFLLNSSNGLVTGEPLRHERRVNTAVFSLDGTRVLTASDDYSARLWDAASGRPLAEPLRHNDPVNSAVFSPDGGRILTASGPYALLWDVGSCQLVCELRGDMFKLSSAVFSPDGKSILTTSKDHTLRLWDAMSGELLAKPLCHKQEVTCSVFSPDGKLILIGSGARHEAGRAQVWDASTGDPLGESLRHENTVASAVFSPDGTRILTASWDKTVRLWDAHKGQLILEPLLHENFVLSAVFSPDGMRILTATAEGYTRLWEAASGHSLTEPQRNASSGCTAVFSPDGGRILTTSTIDETMTVWDAATGRSLAEPLRHQGSVNSAVFSPNGKRVLTASFDGSARLWDAASGYPLSEPLRHTSSVRNAVFSPDGKRVLTSSWDYTARLWDSESFEAIGNPLCHTCEVNSAAFDFDGHRILTTQGYVARLWLCFWDTGVFHLVKNVLLRHAEIVCSAVFSPDGRRMLTASRDKTACLWDANNGCALSEPLVHHGWVNSAVFSPDGKQILTASSDNYAQLWDAETGQMIADPLRHVNGVNSAVFSPHGCWILTASADGTAQLWDNESGQSLCLRLRHDDQVRSAVFSPDGARAVTASWDHTARIWHVASADLIGGDTWRLPHLLEIVGGCRFCNRGLLEPIPDADIRRLRNNFDIADGEMNCLLRWWWSDPFTRTINPSSTITVPDYVRRRIREILDLDDEKAKPRCLQDARDAFLNHPLVLLCEAEQGKGSDPAWLMQHAVSRLLAKPHYLTPLEPPNAIGDAKANRQYELTLGLAEDCFLGARLLLQSGTRVPSRDASPSREGTRELLCTDLAKQVLARALKLAPENEAYRKLAGEIGM